MYVKPVLYMSMSCQVAAWVKLAVFTRLTHLNSISRSTAELEHGLGHRACYGVLRFIMESGAKGCEVIVSGKLRAQRAKAMKFKDGFMIASGNPVHDYIDGAVRHVMLRQGVLGIKVCLSPLSKPVNALCWCLYVLNVGCSLLNSRRIAWPLAGQEAQHLHACSLRSERLCTTVFASLVGTQWYNPVLT